MKEKRLPRPALLGAIVLFAFCGYLVFTMSQPAIALTPTPVTTAMCGFTQFEIGEDGVLRGWGEAVPPLPWGEDAPSYYEEPYPVFEGAFSVWGGRFELLVLDEQYDLWSARDGFSGSGLERIGAWVKLLSNVNQASAGLHHGVALTNNGEVWTWGMNDKGQLGNGATNFNDPTLIVPAPVFENAVYVYAEHHSTYAVTASGALYGWGEDVGTNRPQLLEQKVDLEALNILQE